MNDSTANETEASAWEDYWAKANPGTFTTGGPQDQALEDFWLAWFTSGALSDGGGIRILDLACGRGAVTGFALRVARNNLKEFRITALDRSQSAVDLLKTEHPEVTTLCGSADDIPLPDEFFDRIASQFGIEYAPPEAAEEATRLLRPGGSLAFIMHQRDGAIYDECRGNRDALQGVLDSGVLPAFVRLFNESAALRIGEGSRVGFEQADRDLSPCVKAMEAVLIEHGRDIGGGLVFHVYKDIAHMYQKMANFEPAEVVAWADKVRGGLEAYRERMQTMLDAALDTSELQHWRDRLTAGGITLAETTSLEMGEEKRAAAWILKGTKSQ